MSNCVSVSQDLLVIQRQHLLLHVRSRPKLAQKAIGRLEKSPTAENLFWPDLDDLAICSGTEKLNRCKSPIVICQDNRCKKNEIKWSLGAQIQYRPLILLFRENIFHYFSIYI